MVVVESSLFNGALSSVSIVRALGLLNWMPNLMICGFPSASVRFMHSMFRQVAFCWVTLLSVGRVMRLMAYRVRLGLVYGSG